MWEWLMAKIEMPRFIAIILFLIIFAALGLTIFMLWVSTLQDKKLKIKRKYVVLYLDGEESLVLPLNKKNIHRVCVLTQNETRRYQIRMEKR